ncbi:hypothetical protein [uncultured Methanospirillum sp.]|uniref:hypothetical protein n=1 Tax=uncultured Methanospirillum sp. TaxID=262503 RepID=UPI0029C87312|nr:hypothetical protein [uncultured Methanospirillum sp.]
MTRSGVIKALSAIIFILLFIPILSPAEPICVTIMTNDGQENYSTQDDLSNSYVTISRSGSSDTVKSGNTVTYGIAESIGTGTENIVIVKIYNVSEMSDPNNPGVLQILNPEEDKYFSDAIAPGQTQQYVRVSWSQPSALNLTIYTPDGEYGPYHDDADGKMDQAIFMKINSTEGLDPGRWYYRVHGEHLQSPVPFQIETWQE